MTQFDTLQTLGYSVEPTDRDVSLISGYGIHLYVRNDDVSTLDTLIGSGADLWRKFQFNHREEAAALAQIQARSEFTITQPDPTKLEWHVTGPNGFDRVVTLTNIFQVQRDIDAIPSPPGVAERIAYALAADTTNDPAAIKQAIIHAIAG